MLRRNGVRSLAARLEPGSLFLNRGLSDVVKQDLTRFEWGVSVELGAGEELRCT